MTKRILNEGELKVSKKNLIILQEELEYREIVQLPRIELTLGTAELVIKKQLKEEEIKKKMILNEIENYKKSINILHDQIHNGIEEKEITKTEEK